MMTRNNSRNPKENFMKESPYYVGHNVTTSPAAIVYHLRPFGQGSEISCSVKQNGNNHLLKQASSQQEAANHAHDDYPAAVPAEAQNGKPESPKLEDSEASRLDQQSKLFTLMKSRNNENSTNAPSSMEGSRSEASKELKADPDGFASSDKKNYWQPGTLSSTENLESKSYAVPPKAEFEQPRIINWQACAMSKTRNAIALSGVAAAFYNGGWLPLSGQVATENLSELNEFIVESRMEVEAGLPGRSLIVVIGSQIADLDSVVSTLCYAYLLHCKRQEKEKCFVPVINMKRSDLPVHTESFWLFKSMGVDVESLIFVDEISLSYYHRFGNLRLVLVDHNKLEPLHEGLKDAIVEILDHEMSEDYNSERNGFEVEQVGSCCTLVAEKCASEAPELLQGRGLSRLLLAGILLDTSNLDLSTGQCSIRDICMATLLLNGAGRYGRNGFFKILRKRMFDFSVLSSRDLLNKDFRPWTSRTGSSGRSYRIGLSSLGISINRFLSAETAVCDDVTLFRKSRNLDVLLLVTGHYDRSEKFNRELLIAAESDELVHSLTEFYNAQDLQLQLLQFVGMAPGMRAFAQGNINTSRTLIQHMTENFFKKQ